MVERSVSVKLKGDISDYQRAMLEAGASTRVLSKELDSTSGRMTILAESALALGPALVPISAAAVPAVAGLSNQLGIGAAAAGVAVLAFHGLGKALDAVNQYGIDPTDANLKKMNETMASMGPAGRDFVLFLQKVRPELQGLQDAAQAGLFPGLEVGLRSLSGLLPDVERIITTISTTLGGLADEAGMNLDTPKWHEFMDFLNTEAQPTLLAMGYTAGNLATGLANLWMAFAPLSNNFSQSFLGLARDFATWTDGLDKTQGFQDFVAYINDVGPKAWDTLGSIANAILQIVEAAAPIGAATLPIIKALADAIAAIADSDLGPAVIGILAVTSALSRLSAAQVAINGPGLAGDVFGKRSGLAGAVAAAKDLPAATRAYLTLGSTVEKTGYKLGQFSATSERLGTSLKGTAKLAGAGVGLAAVMSGVTDEVGLSNTVMGAMAGSVLPGVGTAVGAAAGAFLDLRAQVDGATQTAAGFQQAFDKAGGSLEGQAAVIAQYKTFIAEFEKAAPSGFGDQIDKLKTGLHSLEGQQATSTQAVQDALFAQNGLAGSMVSATQKTRDQATAVLTLRDAHNDLTNELLTSKNAQLTYEKALDDAAAGAAKNKKGLDVNTAAGRTNLQLLYTLAGAWNGLTDAQRNAPGAADRARKAFIATAIQMGANKREAEKMAAAYLGIPDSVATKILVKGQAEAKKAIDAVKKLLANLDGKTATTHIVTLQRTKSLKATGGYILGPGTTTSDSIPALLSNKEYVIKAAAVAKYGVHMFDRLNAGTFANGGRVQRFAAGGSVSVSPAVSDSSASPNLADAVREGARQGARDGIDGATLKMAADNRSGILLQRGA